MSNSLAMCSKAQASDGSRNYVPLTKTVPRPYLRVLPNDPYFHPRRLVMSDRDWDQWEFSCGGFGGVGLLEAYERRLESLDQRDDQLFPADYVKVSFLIAVHGYKRFRHIKSVQRTRGGIALPTLRHRVVECVAEAVFAFLKQAETTSDHDGSVAFGSGGLQLQDLYLLELHRHGKTLIPVLGYVPPTLLEFGWLQSAGAFASA
ncbi:uncharacterized protein PHACADRAFT_210237 [Phanerochaete carnosa HHB-10118-sp]|uniref:Uncharacterized protein n=1 Tax=Phanerochaete carnosa (strain HHB-10118-sp) TaxID=650164 RepID=K5WVH4_PHACS|nr:uncharacterized protein PHACADRAFT_210237 [Phanerochaete carnosa HHB-10118-sp]EKM54437.1 hypothetical protein PHACADRAFT_210237 [Phanerochaete carnosa HHB-10118-sp]